MNMIVLPVGRCFNVYLVDKGCFLPGCPFETREEAEWYIHWLNSGTTH